MTNTINIAEKRQMKVDNTFYEPRPPSAAENTGLIELLRLESSIRQVGNEQELIYHLANETRRILRFRQSFVLVRKSKKNFQVKAVSSLALIERNSPMIRWIEKLIYRMGQDKGLTGMTSFTSAMYCEDSDREVSEYPFPNFLWVALTTRDGKVFGGVLFAGEDPWGEEKRIIAKRLAEAYSYAWLALKPHMGNQTKRHKTKSALLYFIAALAIIAAFVPVHLTTIAPVEVMGRVPFVVTSPLNGVIKTIEVEPSAKVTRGQILVRFDDTELRNALVVAESKVLVANAKFRQLQQSLFVNSEQARELTVARAELKLAEAEKNLAAERLERTTIISDMAGVASFGDPRELVNLPVTVGGKIMEIIDPTQTEFTIYLPIKDSIVLYNGARIRIFLDSAPLTPIEAVLERASYHAKLGQNSKLVYRVIAALAAKDQKRNDLRIGARGSAQIFGEKVPFYFFLLRRPIAWVRQTFAI